MAQRLEDILLDADEQGDWEPVHVASVAELAGFVPEMAKCHENAKRFAAKNPDHLVVEGWIPIGSQIFIKHSVVRAPGKELICVTLGLQNERVRGLIIHQAKWSELTFADLNPQIIALRIPSDGTTKKTPEGA